MASILHDSRPTILARRATVPDRVCLLMGWPRGRSCLPTEWPPDSGCLLQTEWGPDVPCLRMVMVRIRGSRGTAGLSRATRHSNSNSRDTARGRGKGWLRRAPQTTTLSHPWVHHRTVMGTLPTLRTLGLPLSLPEAVAFATPHLQDLSGRSTTEVVLCLQCLVILVISLLPTACIWDAMALLALLPRVSLHPEARP